ncbi:MAG: hypothetical protein WA666_07190 [Nitrospirota bacterium]
MKIMSFKKIFLGIEPPPETGSEIRATDNKSWRLIDIIWWPVETEGQAKQAVFVCLIFTCYYAVTWITSALNNIFTVSWSGNFNIITNLFSAILQPAIMILIAWGLFKIKRGAAIAAFSIYFLRIIWSGYYMITKNPMATWDWEIPILFRHAISAFIYFQGIRGVSSYRRLCQSYTASVEKEI